MRLQSLPRRALIHPFRPGHPLRQIESFELLYLFDEYVGHSLWYLALFGAYALYFGQCFAPAAKTTSSLPVVAWVLLAFNVLYQWYLVTEGQIFVLSLVTLTVMAVIKAQREAAGLRMTSNGQFLWRSFIYTTCLVVAWVSHCRPGSALAVLL